MSDLPLNVNELKKFFEYIKHVDCIFPLSLLHPFYRDFFLVFPKFNILLTALFTNTGEKFILLSANSHLSFICWRKIKCMQNILLLTIMFCFIIILFFKQLFVGSCPLPLPGEGGIRLGGEKKSLTLSVRATAYHLLLPPSLSVSQ